MPRFDGRWLTSFGSMELQQEGNRVSGTYTYEGVPCTIAGELENERFVFHYQEAEEAGDGWFELTSFGRFHGQYLPHDAGQWRDWQGQREWEGIWTTSFGRMRLIQEEDRIVGCYDGAGPARIEGRLEGPRFVFRYEEPHVQGEGWFQLADDARTFEGRWHPDGASDERHWAGRRLLPKPNLTWLMVFEAYWQLSLAEGEYSYGTMLKEFFARLPNVAVRQRFFNDESSLQRWLQEMMYVPEPAIVLISSHGSPDGVTVHGQTINTKLVVDSLRQANHILLLHFAACSMLQEDADGDFALRLGQEAPFPISGYNVGVDWGGSAVSEFGYFDMILSKHLPPEEAALRLPKLFTYLGDHAPEESPYAAIGFRFFKPRSKMPLKLEKEPILWA